MNIIVCKCYEYNEIVWGFIKDFGNTQNYWEVSYYGGKNPNFSKKEREEMEEGEGYEKYFRREVCKSKEVITDEELVEFHKNNLFQSKYFLSKVE